MAGWGGNAGCALDDKTTIASASGTAALGTLRNSRQRASSMPTHTLRASNQTTSAAPAALLARRGLRRALTSTIAIKPHAITSGDRAGARIFETNANITDQPPGPSRLHDHLGCESF